MKKIGIFAGSVGRSGIWHFEDKKDFKSEKLFILL